MRDGMKVKNPTADLSWIGVRKAAFYRILTLPQIGPDELFGQDTLLWLNTSILERISGRMD